MRYRDIIAEKDEIVPIIDEKKIRKAEADGFDTGKIWYHGTTRKFSSFKLPKRGGIDELGKGVYITRYIGTANVWAQGAGRVLACVINQGKLVEFSDMPISQLWSSGPGADSRWANPLWQDAYKGHCLRMERDFSIPGHSAALDWREWAERVNRREISIASCLSEVGYIGATNKYSQISGQAVIWEPENVRIVGEAPGYEGWVPDRDD